MPRLPSNLVSKPPAFDNPLRRTTPAHVENVLPADAALSAIETTEHTAPSYNRDAGDVGELRGGAGAGGIVIPFAGSTRDSQPEATATPMNHRITVRIEDATRCALEAECHRRRIAGEKTNVSEIARGLLAQWAGQR
jgi:hypothetical protein